MRGASQSIPPMRPGFNPAPGAGESSDIRDQPWFVVRLHDPLAQQSLEQMAVGYEALVRSAEKLTEPRLVPLPNPAD